MSIYLKNKDTLQLDEFEFKCSIGLNGLTRDKIEGDKRTPKGVFAIGNLYYRSDKIQKPLTKLKCIKITKNMGWCNDVKSKKYYNKLIKIKKKISHEKLSRKDFKYDLMIPIKYNFGKVVPGKGSCIFIHLTRNYKPTAGCIAIKKNDFLIMLKLIKKNSKIKIY